MYSDPVARSAHGAWPTVRCLRIRRLGLFTLLIVLLAGGLAPGAVAAKRRVPFGFFGTVLDPTITGVVSASTLNATMAQMARSGVESVRSNIFWPSVEPSPGQYDFSGSDKLVLAAAAHGLSLLPIIEYSPAWASSGPPDSPVINRYPPKDPSTFAAFMTTMIGRYGPHGTLWKLAPGLRRYAVRDWQMWNEPEGTYDWAARPWPSTYAAFLRTGYRAVHAADPGAKVVLAAMVGLNQKDLLPWIEAHALYRLGAKRYFDVMAVNAFTYSDNVTASVHRSVLIVSKVRAVMRAYGDGHKPIWVTEVTWPASKGKVPKADLVGFETTAAGQAKRLSAYYAYIAKYRAIGISRAFWYTWATSYSRSKLNGITPTFAFSGLTRWTPGSAFHPLPVLVAYERAAARFEGCRKSDVATRCR